MKFLIPPIIIISLIAVFCMGFIFGSVLQQAHFIKGAVEIAEGMDGTNFNIEIDINETLMVDRAMDKMNEFGMFEMIDENKLKEVKQ